MLAFHTVDSIMSGQPFVEKTKIGVYKLSDVGVVLQHMVEEHFRFANHRDSQQFVELGVQVGIRFGEVNVAEVKPLSGKIARECGRLG